jgi:predicted nucleic acid-binding Zn ribbon protein
MIKHKWKKVKLTTMNLPPKQVNGLHCVKCGLDVMKDDVLKNTNCSELLMKEKDKKSLKRNVGMDKSLKCNVCKHNLVYSEEDKMFFCPNCGQKYD